MQDMSHELSIEAQPAPVTVRLAQTALVVIDMQKDFLYPGGYGEFGIKEIGVKGYRDFGIITPHVSFLALEFRPKEALSNIRELIKRYAIIGEYGFYDSVKIRGKETVTPKYLALDQGMILVSITNYLKRGIIRDYFHEDPSVARTEHLLQEERFF